MMRVGPELDSAEVYIKIDGRLPGQSAQPPVAVAMEDRRRQELRQSIDAYECF
jgi:hypothetical protein